MVVTFDIDEPPERAGLRHLPRLTREGLRIDWAAGRFDVMVTAALQVVGGFGIAALLLPGQAVLDALLRAVQESGSLILHRFSSVRSADRIYVLHHGEIVEAGGHAALMELDGTYAELFTLQAASYVD